MSVSKLHDILKEGVSKGASDWHIREESPVGLRIDGEMTTMDTIADPDFMKAVLEDVVSGRKMDLYEETGDSDFAIMEQDVGRFRVNLHRQRGLDCLTLRHVKSEVPNLENLRLPPIILPMAECRSMRSPLTIRPSPNCS